ncbi:hypothetical protein PMIN02_010735 [Paraphaeosphaeria minitans]
MCPAMVTSQGDDDDEPQRAATFPPSNNKNHDEETNKKYIDALHPLTHCCYLGIFCKHTHTHTHTLVDVASLLSLKAPSFLPQPRLLPDEPCWTSFLSSRFLCSRFVVHCDGFLFALHPFSTSIL